MRWLEMSMAPLTRMTTFVFAAECKVSTFSIRASFCGKAVVASSRNSASVQASELLRCRASVRVTGSALAMRTS